MYIMGKHYIKVKVKAQISFQNMIFAETSLQYKIMIDAFLLYKTPGKLTQHNTFL